MKRKRVIALGICAGFLGAAWLAGLLRPKPEVLYQVTFLPMLNGALGIPRAINDNGQVVGVAEATRGQWHMFLWDGEEGSRDLGPCADPQRFESMRINDAGQIAGTAVDPNGTARAFLQDPNGARFILRGPDDAQVHIQGLNRRGQVVGYYHAERGPRQAFIWDRANGMQTLYAPGDLESVARSVNDAGQAVGFFSVRGVNQWYACLWDPNTGTQNLGPAQFGPAQTCRINNRGLVVGQFGSAQEQTWLSTWTRQEGAQRLDSYGASVQVSGMDDAGRFVARAEWTASGLLASRSSARPVSYLWDPNDGWREIRRHLGRRDVADLTVVDMNNRSQILALLKLKKQSDPRGVILEPIERGLAAQD